MKYRRLGKGILKISELSLGMWENFGRIDDKVARDIFMYCYENGINSFDNADEYGGTGNAEQIMGKLLKEVKRTDVVISSKCFWDVGPGPNDRGLSRKHIFESVHQSLRNMEVDYIDFYYAHRYENAVIDQMDPDLEEVVRAFDDLVHQGKILYWGTSSWNGVQLSQAYGLCNQLNLYRPYYEQSMYNMFHREAVERDLIPTAKKLGFGILTYSPLCNGILSGKYNEGIPENSRLGNPSLAWLGLDRDLTPENIEKVKKLSEVASDLGGTTAQLAIAWLLRHPELTSVIIGGTKVWQVEDNVKAIDFVDKLTPDVLDRIEEILDNNPVKILFTDTNEKPDFD